MTKSVFVLLQQHNLYILWKIFRTKIQINVFQIRCDKKCQVYCEQKRVCLNLFLFLRGHEAYDVDELISIISLAFSTVSFHFSLNNSTVFLITCYRYWILSWAVTLEISAARKQSDKPVKNL
jgi:hypothetical protein